MKNLILSVMLAGAVWPVAAEPGPGMPPPPADLVAIRHQQADDVALLLGLAAAQRPALEAFLQADGPPLHGQGEERRTAPAGFEQQLARREAADAEHARHDRARLGAVRAFYADLDAHQKQLFEALMRLRHAPGGPHGDRGPGGPGGPHHLDGPPQLEQPRG